LLEIPSGKKPFTQHEQKLQSSFSRAHPSHYPFLDAFVLPNRILKPPVFLLSDLTDPLQAADALFNLLYVYSVSVEILQSLAAWAQARAPNRPEMHWFVLSDTCFGGRVLGRNSWMMLFMVGGTQAWTTLTLALLGPDAIAVRGTVRYDSGRYRKRHAH
jgi:hypothetical protein